MTDASEYIHGSSPEEQRRLSLLNGILNDACLRELNVFEGARVLDVGSGLGQFSRLIARTVGPNGQVIGVERDADQLHQAKRLAELAGEADLVTFQAGDALDLPLTLSDENTFDVAHARFLLEHIPDPGRVIAQMIRAVRPGGRVFISDDDHDNFRPWPEPRGFEPLWDAYVQSYERLGNDPYVGRKLVSLLRENGLVTIRNSCVFFGGCAGNERFEAVADNLIGALEGAEETILSEKLISKEVFDTGIAGVYEWKAHPSAVLWYTVCCAEGTVPPRGGSPN